jgi:hypothetical protein
MTFVIGTPHTNGAGYLLNNQDLSIAKRQEADVRTCTHCQAVIKMQEWKDDGAWCSKCNAPVCAHGECAKKTELVGCVPYVKYIETIIESDVTKRQFRQMVGLDEQPADYQPKIFLGVQNG